MLFQHKLNKYKALLKRELVSDYSRYLHSLYVMQISLEIASFHSTLQKHELQNLTIAALLHDLSKNTSLAEAKNYLSPYNIEIPADCIEFPVSLHGFMSFIRLQKELHIKDTSLLIAVRYHTTGHTSLTQIGYILYIADFLASVRNKEIINDVFTISTRNLNKATALTCRLKIEYLKNNHIDIHPYSIEFLEFLNTF